MLVSSVEIVSFSVDPYCVLVEGDIISNILFGIVDLFGRWSEDCWMLLRFLDNQLVKRVAHYMILYHLWPCLISDRISTIPIHLAMLLM